MRTESSDSVSYEQSGLVAELQRRCPLVTRVDGRFGKDTKKEPIPLFFGLLLSAATKRGPGPCCFVLDKSPGTTAFTAVLLALARLQVEFPELAKIFAREGFRKGQRVKVKPKNFVYEYEGIWEEFPGFFRLKVMGEGTWLSFPVAEVLRIEPTDRLRPKGKGNTSLGQFERSRLDKLLDLKTCGNNSLIRNSVFLFMPRARFAQAMDSITLGGRQTNEVGCLSAYLPWGSIGREGKVKSIDAYQVRGEPLVAVTGVPEDLAMATSAAMVGTKVVVVDGARSVARDLQAFEEVADLQRMIIIASPEETDALDLLRERGIPVWYMTPDEILIGEPRNRARSRASLVGATIRSAETRRQLNVTAVDTHDEALQEVAASLENAAKNIGNDDEAQEGIEILGRVYGILLDCSECCFGVGDEIRKNLQAVSETVTRSGMWLDSAVTREFRSAIRGLKNATDSESFGQNKADALLEIVLGNLHEEWLVAARLPRTAECLRNGLRDQGIDVPVLSVPAIRRNRDYAGIICPAWPNKQRFTRLMNLAVTPEIRVLAYPFENKWILSHQARERANRNSNVLDVETRSSILGIPSRFFVSQKSPEPDVVPVNKVPTVPVFRIEERLSQSRSRRASDVADAEDSREAQLVQFVGDCYTLLTQWAELPKLNEVIDSGRSEDFSVKAVTATQLSQGDYVLFRASGDKEFTRMIAEEILGKEKYERVRTVAELWRSPLRSLGESVSEVQLALAAHGLHRTPVTIAGWLDNPYRIAPGDFGDIEVIARAAGDTDLLSIKEEVKNAISRIRSSHIRAGSRLTKLIIGELVGRLHDLDDQPVLLDLEYGEAWVVQVDRVEMKRQRYPSNLVNQLLWAEDTLF